MQTAVGSLREDICIRQVRRGIRMGVLDPAILEWNFEGRINQVTKRVSKTNLTFVEKHRSIKQQGVDQARV